MWQSGIKVVDGIQVTNQLDLEKEGLSCAILIGPVQSQLSLKVEEVGRRGSQGKRNDDGSRIRGTTLLTLEDGGGIHELVNVGDF